MTSSTNHEQTSELLPIDIMAGPEYHARFREDVQKLQAGGRLALTTMGFETKWPEVSGLMTAMSEAAMRGAEVHIGVDAYSFMIESTSLFPGPLLVPLPFGQQRFHSRKAALDTLNAFPNAHTQIVNKPSGMLHNPLAGRSHIKAGVIQDTTYVSNGNLNLTDDEDITIAIKESGLASKVFEVLTSIISSGYTRPVLGNSDQLWHVDPATDLLIDAGLPRQSVIFERAMEVIDNADEWLVMGTQYYPEKEVIQRLLKAYNRGVDIRLPYNDPSVQGILEKLPERIAARHFKRLPHALQTGCIKRPQRKMHLKAIANETEAITGNHNFSPRGVRLGTAEMSLYRHTNAFSLEIANFVLSRVHMSPIYADDKQLTLAS